MSKNRKDKKHSKHHRKSTLAVFLLSAAVPALLAWRESRKGADNLFQRTKERLSRSGSDETMPTATDIRVPTA